MVTGLKHRIPVRVRHYWKLLAVCAAVVTGLVTLAGNVQVTPLVTSAAEVKGDQVVQDFAGTVDLFDHELPHTISVSLDPTEYDRMLDNYMTTGDKEYVRADMTIDGTYLPEVGLRLKGNSTLSALTHEGKTRNLFGDRGRQPDPALPGGVGGPGIDPNFPPGGGANPPPGGQPGQGPGNLRFGPGGNRTPLDSAKPEELPWLISFDEFVKGRRYQGRSELAVRVSGMGGGTTVINEALSLALLAKAGETTQRYTYASLHINSRPVRARLLVEHPDTGFATGLGNGVLYKSLASSQFTYQGEDPTAYEDDFKQINGKGSYDIKPVIDFAKWVGESTDADFAAHLADRLDVESFARYVAAQSLLMNFDDMAGPGHNYYLWYHLDSKRFEVLSWDHNLTFSGMGGPRGGGVMQAGPGGPGGMRAGNKLKERFLAATSFKALYDNAYSDLKQRFFGNNNAVATLDAIAAGLAKLEGADPATVTSDADRLRGSLSEQPAG
ncbi:CotH kinase family protein [Rhizocola hellebori]|nr:CotH kinase family protein [Rhizocola hellebori]